MLGNNIFKARMALSNKDLIVGLKMGDITPGDYGSSGR